jgi:hypothetical protein
MAAVRRSDLFSAYFHSACIDDVAHVMVNNNI